MRNNRLRIGVAATGLSVILAAALGAIGGLAPSGERVALGASTTLTIIAGPIFVRHPNGELAAAEDGAVLGTGDTIRTGPDGRAVLTYFEGSTVEIEPGSELTIDAAHANPDGSTVIRMQQSLGTTWHVVTHLLQGGSKYEIRTPASTASVRGTQFTLSVGPDGTTVETTTEGVVANADPEGTATVLVRPGLRTTTRRGEKPSPAVPAPEPERKTTVTVGNQNALVVDAFGRANGIRGGKKVLQTPGAQLAIVDGHLVVTLPNLPDGALATRVLDPDGDADVTTQVEERGGELGKRKDSEPPAKIGAGGAGKLAETARATSAPRPASPQPAVPEPLTLTVSPASGRPSASPSVSAGKLPGP